MLAAGLAAVTRPAGPAVAPGATAGLAGSAVPAGKAARQAQVIGILARDAQPVRSQEELAERLGQRGIRVTQATLSRDLEELGAVRLRGGDGGLVYALPGEPGSGAGAIGPDAAGAAAAAAARLARLIPDLLISAEASANLVVARTPAGAAQLLASAVDQASWQSVLGTVGGDDTVLIIAREPDGGAQLARALLRLGAAPPSRQTADQVPESPSSQFLRS